MLETKQSLVSSLQELSKIFSNDDHLLYWERFQEDYNSLRKLLAKAMSHINSLQTEKRFIDKRFSTNEKTESSIQSDDALYIIKDILTKTAKQ